MAAVGGMGEKDSVQDGDDSTDKHLSPIAEMCKRNGISYDCRCGESNSKSEDSKRMRAATKVNGVTKIIACMATPTLRSRASEKTKSFFPDLQRKKRRSPKNDKSDGKESGSLVTEEVEVDCVNNNRKTRSSSGTVSIGSGGEHRVPCGEQGVLLTTGSASSAPSPPSLPPPHPCCAVRGPALCSSEAEPRPAATITTAGISTPEQEQEQDSRSSPCNAGALPHSGAHHVTQTAPSAHGSIPKGSTNNIPKHCTGAAPFCTTLKLNMCCGADGGQDACTCPKGQKSPRHNFNMSDKSNSQCRNEKVRLNGQHKVKGSVNESKGQVSVKEAVAEEEVGSPGASYIGQSRGSADLTPPTPPTPPSCSKDGTSCGTTEATTSGSTVGRQCPLKQVPRNGLHLSMEDRLTVVSTLDGGLSSCLSTPLSPDTSRSCTPTTSTSGSASVASDDASSRSGANKSGDASAICQWNNCGMDLNEADLMDHIRGNHVVAEKRDDKDVYVCYWRGCKVYDRGSSSKTWLERHILVHSGDKPFRCILGGCGQRFTSDSALERHINSHFNTYQTGSQQNKSARPRSDDTPSKQQKKRSKLKRTKSWLMKTEDYFDSRVMETIRHNLIKFSNHTHIDQTSSGTTVTFHSTVIAKRTEDSGKVYVLLRWTPADVLPDCWVQESQVVPQVALPVSSLPRDTAANLDASLYTPHRYRKHRRK